MPRYFPAIVTCNVCYVATDPTHFSLIINIYISILSLNCYRFEGYLKSLSVDPHLDPSYLAPVSQSHVSNLYVGEGEGGPHHPTRSAPLGSRGDYNNTQHPIGTNKDVAEIKRRMKMIKGEKKLILY